MTGRETEPQQQDEAPDPLAERARLASLEYFLARSQTFDQRIAAVAARTGLPARFFFNPNRSGCFTLKGRSWSDVSIHIFKHTTRYTRVPPAVPLKAALKRRVLVIDENTFRYSGTPDQAGLVALLQSHGRDVVENLFRGYSIDRQPAFIHRCWVEVDANVTIDIYVSGEKDA
jgi:hypothetical protein